MQLNANAEDEPAIDWNKPEYDTGAGLTTSRSHEHLHETSFYGQWVAGVGGLLVVEMVLVKTVGVELQQASQALTNYYQTALDSEYVEGLSDMMHHTVTSHVWLLLCALVYWAVDSFEGAHLYCLTALGYALKSLAKNLLRSPRVFWVAPGMHCFYCGKGFSLPSGHSMVSWVVLLFLALKIREPWIIILALMFEILTFVNVIFIGTHSFADVIVGWTAATFVVLLFVWLEAYLKPFFAVRREPSARQQLPFFAAIIGCILLLDLADSHHSSPAFPLEWRLNMGRACHMDPDDTQAQMYLHMRCSNTPLAIGVGTGQLLRRSFLVTEKIGNMDSTTAGERMIVAVAGGFLFLRLSVYVRRALVWGGHPEYFYHTYNFLEPVVVLFGVPALCLFFTRRVLGWNRRPRGLRKKKSTKFQ